MRCFRRVLGISYIEHITNEAVHATITKHMKRYEELLTTVKKRKLRWYGQEPVAYRRLSSKALFKVEEEGTGRERNGRTALLSGQERALLQVKPLPMTVRWKYLVQRSSMQHPPTPGRVKGLVIVVIQTTITQQWGPVRVHAEKDTPTH